MNETQLLMEKLENVENEILSLKKEISEWIEIYQKILDMKIPESVPEEDEKIAIEREEEVVDLEEIRRKICTP